MTLTESPPVAADSEATSTADLAAAASPDINPSNPSSSSPNPSSSSTSNSNPSNKVIEQICTSDHVVIGRLFIVVSLALALAALLLGVLLGSVRADSSLTADFFAGVNSWFQMWTLYRIMIVLGVVMPLVLGLAMTVIPSQIGATRLAFPRAALASFWTWLVGAVIVIASVFAGGGWGALDGVTAAENDAIALTLLGTAMLIVALLLGAIVVATTVISLRQPGMTLLDTPPFAWSMLVAASVWLFTLPVAVANIVIVYADLRGRAPISFGQPEGSDIWFQLDWITEQPAIYVLAVPVLGIIAQMTNTVTGSPSSRPPVITAAIGGLGLLSIGGWSQDFFTSGLPGSADHRSEVVYVAFGLAAALPVLAVAGGVADSLKRGIDGFAALSGLLSTRFLSAAVGLMLLGGAVFAGVLRVIEPFELLDRSTNTGIFNAVALAGLLAAIAALWHWSSTIFCRAAPELPGRISVALLLVGGVLLAGPDVVSGFLGAEDFDPLLIGSILETESAAVAISTPSDTVETLNTVSALGSLLVVLGFVGVLTGVVASMRGGGPGNSRNLAEDGTPDGSKSAGDDGSRSTAASTAVGNLVRGGR